MAHPLKAQGAAVAGALPSSMAPGQSSTDRVHALLREAIITGQLEGDSRHSIYELAANLGVSRTPVRDAVLRLADTGMVDIERNRGVRIRALSVQDVQEIFQARLLVEVPAARHAAAHVTQGLLDEMDSHSRNMRMAAARHEIASFMDHDRRLHSAIIATLENRRLLDFVSNLRDAAQAWGMSTVDRSRALEEIEGEHLPIIEAIKKRDSVLSGTLMRAHLVHTGVLLMRQLAIARSETLPLDGQSAFDEWG